MRMKVVSIGQRLSDGLELKLQSRIKHKFVMFKPFHGQGRAHDRERVWDHMAKMPLMRPFPLPLRLLLRRPRNAHVGYQDRFRLGAGILSNRSIDPWAGFSAGVSHNGPVHGIGWMACGPQLGQTVLTSKLAELGAQRSRHSASRTNPGRD